MVWTVHELETNKDDLEKSNATLQVSFDEAHCNIVAMIERCQLLVKAWNEVDHGWAVTERDLVAQEVELVVAARKIAAPRANLEASEHVCAA